MSRQVTEQEFRFPLRGKDVVTPRTAQGPDTFVDGQNVRIFDSLESRARGGLRYGLSKYLSAQLSGSNRIQNITNITTIANTSPNTSALFVRQVKGVAVSNGTVSMFNTSAFTAAASSGSRSLSNTAPFILSAGLFSKVYFTDGISYRVWDGSDNTVTDWTPTAGSLPGTDGTSVPRLIAMWRSRIVLSGLRTDAHNWFMSRLGNANDFDYDPAEQDKIQAVAGGTGKVGTIGAPINSLMPYTDDVLLIGTDSSIHAMSGDPADGGVLDTLSTSTGTAFGQPFTMDSYGNLYFFSSRGSIHMIAAGGGAPQSLTEGNIDPELRSVDLNTSFVRMAFDDSQLGLYVFISPFSAGATTHYFFDLRTKGWFPISFANTSHNPFAVSVFDGDDPDDRVVLLGGEDGRIRKLDKSVSNDDGTAISSYVLLGPIKAEGNKPFVLSELQAHLDLNSSSMRYEVVVADTPERAILNIAGTFTGDGTFSAGLSPTHNPRKRGYWGYIKVGDTSSSSPWAFEYLRARLSVISSSRGRQRASDTQ